MIADQRQREAAIDIRHSCIVQAPAGSGKTELLIQRTLALLAVVEHPGQILAITFTRKAAAEMRHRLLQALEAARSQPSPNKAHERHTWQLARAALQRQGDELLRNPSLLAIQTIDSFNASLVRRMPWLSRLGGVPELADEAEPLYRQAAEQLLGRLDDDGADGDGLRRLLTHLDNQVIGLRELLVDLLRRRDQWLRHLLPHQESPRETLEAGLQRLIGDRLSALRCAFPASLAAELLFCARFAAAQREDALLEPLAALTALPGVALADLPPWQALAELLLTGDDELRKTVNVRNGFPSDGASRPAKERMLTLLKALADAPDFPGRLARVRNLPEAGYPAGQWEVLQCLVQLLPRLVAELWLVFRSRGQADYAEIALKARQALGAADDPSELLLRTDSDLRHILVDEFQDTSWLQFELLQTLTGGWSAGDGRTLFLVGDPMQSIYRFREAEVGLFLQTFGGRLGEAGPPLQPLQLSCNFRSQGGIVDWVNGSFAQIFPAVVDRAAGGVPLARASAVHAPLPGDACQLHPFVGRDDQAEAQRVLELVQQARREDPAQSIAILVRSRSHLAAILPLLRRHGLKYQAQDIDLLGARQAALDLLNLCRALLQRGDRLAWLAVLRAPWCGLSLADLHLLVAEAPKTSLPCLLDDPARVAQLSPAGQGAVARVWPQLRRALERRGRLPLRALLEGTWLALGGPSCYAAEGVADANLLLGLVEKLEAGGDLPSMSLLEEALERLFAAPDAAADGTLQVMTIHKAKGLQFGTVILPGLGRSTRGADAPLLRWLEHPEYGLLLAPLAERGGSEKDPIYQLIGRLEQEKGNQETARLLYVATTRAISRLHLLGHAKADKNGALKPARGSLLEKLWPVVAADFAARAVVHEEPPAGYAPPMLRRLPSGWRAPRPEAAVYAAPLPVTSASAREAPERELIFSGWESEARRHVGTLVHQQLERIAKFGASCWEKQPPAERERILGRQLSALGVPAAEIAAGVARVRESVERCLGSERGRWILTAHAEQASELPLSGLVNGVPMRAVIDRCFAAEGATWIIDYKTSSPAGGESLADFVAREGEHYREQLRAYQALMALRRPERPVRAALYFPLVDGWYEVGAG